MASSDNRRSRSGRYSGLASDTPTSAKVSWEEVEPGAVALAVRVATELGDALMFSRTRDGGALLITILSGDERIKLYGSTAGEVEAHLAGIAATKE